MVFHVHAINKLLHNFTKFTPTFVENLFIDHNWSCHQKENFATELRNKIDSDLGFLLARFLSKFEGVIHETTYQ